jgi:hypothetical protein
MYDKVSSFVMRASVECSLILVSSGVTCQLPSFVPRWWRGASLFREPPCSIQPAPRFTHSCFDYEGRVDILAVMSVQGPGSVAPSPCDAAP